MVVAVVGRVHLVDADNSAVARPVRNNGLPAVDTAFVVAKAVEGVVRRVEIFLDRALARV